MEIKDFGVIEYSAAWEQQKIYFEPLLADPEGSAQEVVMLCEHPHVYTLGRSGSINNLLVDEDFLSRIGATYFRTDRGGDITYHGYGQIVGYPILSLSRRGLSLRGYIELLEEVIIRTVAGFGITAGRLEGATGVWVQKPTQKPKHGTDKESDLEPPQELRKIAAIGVKASRYVTMHGFALNVSTDLSYFNHIHPCGFVDKGVTSIELETGRSIEMGQVKELFTAHFSELF